SSTAFSSGFSELVIPLSIVISSTSCTFFPAEITTSGSVFLSIVCVLLPMSFVVFISWFCVSFMISIFFSLFLEITSINKSLVSFTLSALLRVNGRCVITSSIFIADSVIGTFAVDSLSVIDSASIVDSTSGAISGFAVGSVVDFDSEVGFSSAKDSWEVLMGDSVSYSVAGTIERVARGHLFVELSRMTYTQGKLNSALKESRDSVKDDFIRITARRCLHRGKDVCATSSRPFPSTASDDDSAAKPLTQLFIERPIERIAFLRRDSTEGLTTKQSPYAKHMRKAIGSPMETRSLALYFVACCYRAINLLMLSMMTLTRCGLLEVSQMIWNKTVSGGITKIGKLDPLRVPLIKIDQSEGDVNYRVILKNLEIIGLNGSVLESVHVACGRLKSNLNETEVGYVSYSDLRDMDSIRYRFHTVTREPSVSKESFQAIVSPTNQTADIRSFLRYQDAHFDRLQQDQHGIRMFEQNRQYDRISSRPVISDGSYKTNLRLAYIQPVYTQNTKGVQEYHRSPQNNKDLIDCISASEIVETRLKNQDARPPVSFNRQSRLDVASSISKIKLSRNIIREQSSYIDIVYADDKTNGSVKHFGNLHTDFRENQRVYGIEDVMKNIRENDNVMHVVLRIRVPLLRVKSQYTLMGKVGKEMLHGNGLLVENFTDVVGDFTLELKKVNEELIIVRGARANLSAIDKEINFHGMDEKESVQIILSHGLIAAEAVAAMLADDFATKGLSERMADALVYRMYKDLPVN
ncbi:hypothetical protein ALC53_07510, partial [Atta colombica]